MLATFTGEIDPIRGTVTIASGAPAPAGALVVIPDVQDGQAGVGPPNTVEFVTDQASIRQVANGCGTVNDFEAAVTLRSFYAGAALQNVRVEILSLTPSGYEACNSSAPAPGVGAAYGLWSYGSLSPAGTAGDAAVRTWKFRLPSAANFQFRGRVVADAVATTCSGRLGLSGMPVTRLGTLLAYAVASGDLNGDGRLDAVVVGRSGSTINVLLGRGDGTFMPPVAYPVPSGSDTRAIALGDINGDGKLDAVTANLAIPGVSLLLGNGDGTFGTASSFTTGGGSAVSVAIGDTNGDAFPEVVVAISGSEIGIYPNVGGTLGPIVRHVVSGAPFDVVLADLDGNGSNDIAYVALFASSVPSSVRARLNDGKGAFPTEVAYPVLDSCTYPALAVGDLTGDGKPELVLSNGYQFGGNTANQVAVYVNDGAGGFAAPVRYVVKGAARDVVVGDFSGDGRADVAVTVTDLGTVSVLVNDGTGGLLPEASYHAMPSPWAIGAADFTGDGRLDLVAVSDTNALAGVLVNGGGGVFPGRFAATTGGAYDSQPYSVAVDDLNGDGIPDAVVANSGSASVSVFIGRGDGTFDPQATYSTGSPWTVTTGDLDLDGSVDVVVATASGVRVFPGSASGVLGVPRDYSFTLNGLYGIAAVGDLNGDGWLDLVVANSKTGGIVVLQNGRDGTFGPPVTYGTSGTTPVAVAVADFNGDGLLDVASANGNATLTPFRNGGGGALVSEGTISLSGAPVSMTAADLDGDGSPDLALVDSGPPGGLSVLPGASTASRVWFGPATSYAALGVPTGVVAGDLTGDGKLDLAVTTSFGLVGLFVNGGMGAFEPMLPYSVIRPWATGIALADLNGDFRLDAVVLENNKATDFIPDRLGSVLGTCRP